MPPDVARSKSVNPRTPMFSSVGTTGCFIEEMFTTVKPNGAPELIFISHHQWDPTIGLTREPAYSCVRDIPRGVASRVTPAESVGVVNMRAGVSVVHTQVLHAPGGVAES